MRAFAVRLICCSLAASAAGFPGQEWSIEEPGAPTRTLKFVATEGTWISLDVAPDGRTIIFDLLGHLYEMPFEGGDATPLTQGRSWNMLPRYSPDGTRIAFTSDRSGRDALWVYDRGTASVTQISKHDLPVSRPSWSDDGRHLYASALDQAGKIRGLQVSLQGTHFELFQTENRATQFVDDSKRDALYFEQSRMKVYEEGDQIKRWDKRTGQVSVLIERPGGAFNPTLSPDARQLAYLHRDDREVVLIVRDLDSRAERVVYRGLNRDRQDVWFDHYGTYPAMAWHPAGKEILVSAWGQIRAVDVETGRARTIPFRAPVHREINETLRFPVDIPESEARTRSHRWAHRTELGILLEALGDLHLESDGAPRNLTASPEHETSPVYDPRTRTLYYAAWSDDLLGAVFARALERGRPRRLTERPGQYGSLALSPDGRTLAFLRGLGAQAGGLIEDETEFELVVLPLGRSERKVTDVTWLGTYENLETKHPPGVVFDPLGEHLYFSEFADGALVLKRIRTDGSDETALYRFPQAVQVVPSPDLKWLAFREYHRSYVTSFDFVGKVITVSAADKEGFAQRVDPLDGDFLG